MKSMSLFDFRVAFGFCCLIQAVTCMSISPLESSSSSSSSPLQPSSIVVTSKSLTIDGPPLDTKPDYENIHGPLGKDIDKLFLSIFRTKMAEKVGVDSKLDKTDYQGLMELTSALNARYSDRREVHKIAKAVLVSLFPGWMPPWFGVLFSRPFPGFSSRLNAWATFIAGTWLMGECEINDCEIDGGGIGKNQGLLVKRCRFLEEAGCASVCVNSCKIPTQNFFAEDMGLPLTMTPDYETGECQFSFGKTPTAAGELEASKTPCLSRCPSSGQMRLWHSKVQPSNPVAQCSLMDVEEVPM